MSISERMSSFVLVLVKQKYNKRRADAVTSAAAGLAQAVGALLMGAAAFFRREEFAFA